MNAKKETIRTAEGEVLYWGFYLKAVRMGHHLWMKAPGGGVRKLRDGDVPWSRADLDGGVLRRARMEDVVDGRVAYARAEGWTVIAFWDRSGDSRPRSNSAFLIRGGPSVAEIKEKAREQWPEVWVRAGFPLGDEGWVRAGREYWEKHREEIKSQIQSLLATIGESNMKVEAPVNAFRPQDWHFGVWLWFLRRFVPDFKEIDDVVDAEIPGWVQAGWDYQRREEEFPGQEWSHTVRLVVEQELKHPECWNHPSKWNYEQWKWFMRNYPLPEEGGFEGALDESQVEVPDDMAGRSGPITYEIREHETLWELWAVRPRAQVCLCTSGGKEGLLNYAETMFGIQVDMLRAQHGIPAPEKSEGHSSQAQTEDVFPCRKCGKDCITTTGCTAGILCGGCGAGNPYPQPWRRTFRVESPAEFLKGVSRDSAKFGIRLLEARTNCAKSMAFGFLMDSARAELVGQITERLSEHREKGLQALSLHQVRELVLQVQSERLWWREL